MFISHRIWYIVLDILLTIYSRQWPVFDNGLLFWGGRNIIVVRFWVISLTIKYFAELYISNWRFSKLGFSKFFNQLFMQNWVYIKSSGGSLYINLDSPGIAVATLILYIFLRKHFNSYFNPTSSCFIFFSISIRY